MTSWGTYYIGDDFRRYRLNWRWHHEVQTTLAMVSGDLICDDFMRYHLDAMWAIADGESVSKNNWQEWKDTFSMVWTLLWSSHWVGQQNKELEIHLEGKETNTKRSFVCLGGMTCWHGNWDTATNRAMHMRRWHNKRMWRFQLWCYQF